MIHLNITITGKVQRVGFRFLAMQNAVKMGITGFIMYVDKDGLYIEVEGPADKIEEFKHWCQKGQCSYHISQISFEKGEMKNFKSFEILSFN
jgi:acylphosphatase